MTLNPTFCLNFCKLYIMKYKKNLGALFVLLTFTWQAFGALNSSYTPTQAILIVLFAYLGLQLTYFVYFKNK